MNPGSGLRIGILGTRGLPPRYGGFETFAAELSRRLVARGHRVTVYGRKHLDGSDALWNGVRRIQLPAVRQKYLETVSHALISSLDALRRDFEVLLVCNAANAFVLPLMRAARVPVAINVDGIERRRSKWNALGRIVYLIGESWSAWFAGRVVADAEVIARYYRERYRVDPEVIAYGAELSGEGPDSGIIDQLGLRPGSFVLYVSRLEPENNPLAVVRAWKRVRSSMPLVMVGDAPYSKRLIAQVRAEADDRVLFPGAIYGPAYRDLQRNAFLYVQATEVGGTHPALIEAMGSGGAVLANDTPEHREVGGEAVVYFRLSDPETLSAELQRLIDDPSVAEALRGPARARVQELYSWDHVTDRYESLFLELASGE